jgi:glutamyl-queuosine tRNA(Asp) synthetase
MEPHSFARTTRDNTAADSVVRPTAPIGRFAPSPTGRLHAGNLFAAVVAWCLAHREGGKMVLRIEDLDPERSRTEYADAIMRDYEWIGLTWDFGPYWQHDREEAYRAAYKRLEREGLVYPCFCSRADLHAASAPHFGEKLVYPGTCRGLSNAERLERVQRKDPSWRLIVPDKDVTFDDILQGSQRQNLTRECGDFVVRRADGAFAYQLAVVLDDAEQGVTQVARGIDLLPSTPQQIYLQSLLGLPHPQYAHFPLMVNESGRRLSKRDHDASIDELRERFHTPERLLGRMAFVAGMMPNDAPLTLEEFAQEADFTKLGGRICAEWS